MLHKVVHHLVNISSVPFSFLFLLINLRFHSQSVSHKFPQSSALRMFGRACASDKAERSRHTMNRRPRLMMKEQDFRDPTSKVNPNFLQLNHLHLHKFIRHLTRHTFSPCTLPSLHIAPSTFLARTEKAFLCSSLRVASCEFDF